VLLTQFIMALHYALTRATQFIEGVLCIIAALCVALFSIAIGAALILAVCATRMIAKTLSFLLRMAFYTAALTVLLIIFIIYGLSFTLPYLLCKAAYSAKNIVLLIINCFKTGKFPGPAAAAAA
jgi:hypothetical protein